MPAKTASGGGPIVWTLAIVYLVAVLAVASRPAEDRTDQLVGEVRQLDFRARRMVLAVPYQVRPVVVTVHSDTTFLRTDFSPARPTDAHTISLREIAVGDRLTVKGALSGDRTSLSARQVLLLPRRRV
jgi:hypothetical protein